MNFKFILLFFGGILFFQAPIFATVASVSYNPALDCIYCRPYYNPATYPLNQNQFYQMYYPTHPYPTYAPWYDLYGATRFNNYYYPAYWQNQGFNGQHYPGNGTVFAAKPNIYIKSESRKKLKINLILKQSTTMLVASPDFSKRENEVFAWDLITQKSKIYHDGQEYPYLYYDFRFDQTLLQNQNGFCDTKAKIIERMVELLQQDEYSRQSIEDFYQHAWTKIPYYSLYCVYPQDASTLNQALIMKADQPISLIRHIFLIKLWNEDNNKNDTYFKKKPLEFKNNKLDLTKLESIQIREWGLAFIQDQ